GNTKKLAEAISAEINTTAQEAKSKESLAKNSPVFLGSGCYARKPGKDMQKFIDRNDFSGRKVALFGTSGDGRGNEIRGMEKYLKEKGAVIVGSFYCKGKSFWIINRKHPTAEDLANARHFANERVQKEGA
ncbi:MAG: flavodoxin, partial [Dehalococcoidia bacterium]|nr:flavodoxin [Dehalococcoidia bacterium]